MAHVMQSRPKRWMEAVRSYWRGPVSLKDPALTSLFGGGPVAAGVTVNERTALNYSAFWACVQVIAGDMSTLPAHHFKRDGSDRRTIDDSHLARLLDSEANPETSTPVFVETLQAYTLSWGNGIAEIERNALGKPVAFWQLEPDRVTPDRTPSGELIYRVAESDGTQVTLAKEDVLHIPGLGYDGVRGYSPAIMARESIGVGLAAERFTGSFFGNGSTFGGLLTTTEGYSEERLKEIRAAFANQHQGVEKAHRFGVLWNGMSYEKVGVDPSVAQLLETRKFQIEEMARWFSIPPHRIAQLDRATFSNIEAQGIAYVQSCLLRWVRRWELELKRKCIPALERRREYVKFNLDGQQRGDIEARYKAYGVGADKGWLNRDEIRAFEDLPPIQGGHGGLYLVQSAQVPLDRIAAMADAQIESAKPQPAPEPSAESAERVDRALQEVRRLEQALVEAKDHAVSRDDAAAQTAAERDVLTRELAAAQSALNAATAQWHAAQRESEAAQAAAAEAERSASDVALRVSAVESDLSERSAALASTKSDLVSAQAALETSLAESRSAIEAQALAEAEVVRAKEAAADAVRRADVAEAARAQADQVAAELTAALDEAKQESVRLEAARSAEAAALVEWQARAEQLSAACTDADARVEVVHAEAAAARDAATAAQQAAEEAQQVVSRLQADLDEAARTIASLDAKAEEYRTGMDEAGERAAKFAAMAADADEAAKRSEQAAEEAASTMASAIAARTDAEALAAKARDEADRLTGLAEEATAQWREALAERDAALSAADAATLARQASEARVQAIEAEESAHAASVESAIAERDEARRLVAEAEAVRNEANMEAERAKQEQQALSEALVASQQNEVSAQAEARALASAKAKAEAALAAAAVADEEATGSVISAHRAMFAHIMRAALERESDRARRAQATPEKLRAWMSTWYDSHAELMSAQLLPAVRVHLAWVRSTEDAETVTRELIAQHIETSRRQLTAVADGDAAALSSSLSRLTDRWMEHRVSVIPDAIMAREVDYVSRRNAA